MTHYPKFFLNKAEYLLCGSRIQPKDSLKLKLLANWAHACWLTYLFSPSASCIFTQLTQPDDNSWNVRSWICYLPSLHLFDLPLSLLWFDCNAASSPIVVVGALRRAHRLDRCDDVVLSKANCVLLHCESQGQGVPWCSSQLWAAPFSSSWSPQRSPPSRLSCWAQESRSLLRGNQAFLLALQPLGTEYSFFHSRLDFRPLSHIYVQCA